MKAIRWGDDDRYWGPVTYCPSSIYTVGVLLGSGDGDDYPGCRLRLHGLRRTLIIALPPFIKPWRRWVDTSQREWSGPGGGYWDTGEREYGFTVGEGHLSVALGRVTNDSSTEQRWGCFLPWTQWRFVARRYYDAGGELAYTETHTGPRSIEEHRAHWDAQDAVPTADFTFHDFDGETLTAKTRIEEYEHKFGTGWFRWLSLFRARRIRRSLDIRFSGETGRRKGSWKGGTIGHGIEMRPGETHEAAFRRYCAEHDMTFLARGEPTESSQ